MKGSEIKQVFGLPSEVHTDVNDVNDMTGKYTGIYLYAKYPKKKYSKYNVCIQILHQLKDPPTVFTVRAFRSDQHQLSEQHLIDGIVKQEGESFYHGKKKFSTGEEVIDFFIAQHAKAYTFHVRVRKKFQRRIETTINWLGTTLPFVRMHPLQDPFRSKDVHQLKDDIATFNQRNTGTVEVENKNSTTTIAGFPITIGDSIFLLLSLCVLEIYWELIYAVFPNIFEKDSLSILVVVVIFAFFKVGWCIITGLRLWLFMNYGLGRYYDVASQRPVLAYFKSVLLGTSPPTIELKIGE